ncbi:MAG: hypothetical protein RI564_00420 [Gracilimonas sp.]|nr:hypothetical protein [Gracilimonas sp.]
MKKIQVYLLFFPLLIVSSCELLNAGDQHTIKEETVVVEAELTSGDLFQYSLGHFGDEEEAEILKAPDHATISQLSISPEEIQYKYQAIAGYTGDDDVIIQSRKGSDGEKPNDQILNTIIRFQINDSAE